MESFSIKEKRKVREQLLKIRWGKLCMKPCDLNAPAPCSGCPLQVEGTRCVLNVIAEMDTVINPEANT